MKRAREETTSWSSEDSSSSEPTRKKPKREPEAGLSTDSSLSNFGAVLEPTKQNEEEQCGICYEPIIFQGKLDTCSHLFCFNCVYKWSKTSNTCPLCKARFTSLTKKQLRSVPASSEAEASGDSDPYLDKPILVRHRDAHFDDDDYLPTAEELEEDYRARLRRALEGSFDDDEDEDFEDEEEDEDHSNLIITAPRIWQDHFLLPTSLNPTDPLHSAPPPDPILPPPHPGPLGGLLHSTSRLPSFFSFSNQHFHHHHHHHHHHPLSFLSGASALPLGICPMVDHLLRLHMGIRMLSPVGSDFLPPPAPIPSLTPTPPLSTTPPLLSPLRGAVSPPEHEAPSFPPSPLAVPARHHHHHHHHHCHIHHHIVHHRSDTTAAAAAAAAVAGTPYPFSNALHLLPPATTTTTTTTTAATTPAPGAVEASHARSPFASISSLLEPSLPAPQQICAAENPSHQPIVVDLTHNDGDTSTGSSTNAEVVDTTPLQTLHPPAMLPSLSRDPFIPSSFPEGRQLPPLTAGAQPHTPILPPVAAIPLPPLHVMASAAASGTVHRPFGDRA